MQIICLLLVYIPILLPILKSLNKQESFNKLSISSDIIFCAK